MEWDTSSLGKRKPMRWRIAVMAAALALFAIMALSLTLVSGLEEQDEETLELILSQQMDLAIERWQVAAGDYQPSVPGMRLYRLDAHDARRSADLPAELRTLARGNHEIMLRDGEHHVAVREHDGVRFILDYDVTAHEARIRDLFVTLAFGAIVLAGMVLVASYWLAGRLTSRLEALAYQIERGEAGQLAAPDMDEEIHVLASTLDRLRARQEEALAREQAFAGNLSHELRTPLTAIRTDAELLAAADLPGRMQFRAERIIEQVDRINEMATSLLLLARDARSQEVALVSLVNALRDAWQATTSDSGLVRLQLVLPDTVAVSADPSLLAVVLQNIFANAERHAPGGVVHCALSGSVLSIRDEGAGFPEAELPFVFDRFFKGEGGQQGLGLALVRHIALASGWEVAAGNTSDGHAYIDIDFAASLNRQ